MGPIVERNIFCSQCRGEPLATTAPATSIRTDLPLTLVAIMYAPPPLDVAWTVAVVRDEDDLSLRVLGVKGTVRDARVVDIGQTRLHLEHNGKIEYLDLLEPSGKHLTRLEVGARTSDPLAAELDRGIRQIGTHSYEIQRATLQAALDNMNAVTASARIIPEIHDGLAAGFRLYSVRREGPLARLGLQNGDVLVAINGLALTSPQAGLEAYAKLRSASHVSLGLERNGSPITLEYQLR